MNRGAQDIIDDLNTNHIKYASDLKIENEKLRKAKLNSDKLKQELCQKIKKKQ